MNMYSTVVHEEETLKSVCKARKGCVMKMYSTVVHAKLEVRHEKVNY